ncbi:MAG: MotA/TolQ/ExbB proton channel family protein [Lachnospiraceae bacterium]|nr:MotA/TolQ/ExbB proton channel family protein [Lachnospiraceae bacterium]
MTHTIANLLGIIIDPIIIAGFIVLLYFMIKIARTLKVKTREISDIYHGKGGKNYVNKKSHTLKQIATAEAKWDDVNTFKGEYSDICAEYSTCASLVPVFPLLGILGTVAGLILQVETQDVGAIFSALNTALSSTLYGLLAAIILKAFESFAIASKMNHIDADLENFELIFNTAVAYRRLDEEDSKDE